jgi:hypothetical protein
MLECKWRRTNWLAGVSNGCKSNQRQASSLVTSERWSLSARVVASSIARNGPAAGAPFFFFLFFITFCMIVTNESSRIISIPINKSFYQRALQDIWEIYIKISTKNKILCFSNKILAKSLPTELELRESTFPHRICCHVRKFPYDSDLVGKHNFFLRFSVETIGQDFFPVKITLKDLSPQNFLRKMSP